LSTRHTLNRHPDTPCDAITSIEVEIVRLSPGILTLTYRVTGAVADIHLPPQTSSERADDLWRRTCFEAFLRPVSGEGYFEFNVAPQGQWAAYQFDGYRVGMALAQVDTPEITAQATADTYELRVSLNLDRLPAPPWRLGLSAVIEETSGRKSYWALTHPPGEPDFHHADGFAVALGRAEP
jgi:hypothetical protein